MTFTTHIIARDKWARFMTIMTVLFLSGLLYSCSSDLSEDFPNVEQQGKAEITFNILTSNTTATRTESHETKEDGNDKENAINSIQVLLYDQNNTFIGKFETSSFTGSQYQGSIDYDKMSKSLDQDNMFKGKIMILANCPEFTGGDLASHTFNFTQEQYNPSNEKGYIPMWGVINAEQKIVKGGSVDFGTVDLLRALAKIELIPGDGFGETQSILSGATLTRHNTSGVCVPAKYTEYTPTDKAEQDVCNLPANVTTSTTSLAFTQDEKGHYILYIPEMAKDNNNTITLSVKNAASKTKEYTINLGYYNTDGSFANNYYDIVRNHIYRYTLNFDAEEDDVISILAIRDWVFGKRATLTPED